MTDNQLLSTNSYDRISRNATLDLEETYGPYLDKIRELFVPSLEYRIHSLLEEFVYSTDSRWSVQFPYFKKFIDAIATWKGHRIKTSEYDIETMEKNVKDDPVTCFLDSLTLYYRLNKISRKLDALGIEDDVLRNLNVWNFVNERKNKKLRNASQVSLDTTIANPDTAADCNAHSSDVMMLTSPRDAKGSARCSEKAIEPLATNDVYREESIEQATTSEYRPTDRQIIDTNQNVPRQQEDDLTRNAAISRNNDQAEFIVESLNEEPCDIETTTKIRNFGTRLKMIVRKMYPEDCDCTTLSGYIVAFLALPCEPSDLIGHIFEADPSLTESCFIVMKRKFVSSVRNVCSCLNDILGKLNVKNTKALCLNCEIHPGYISFKLKSNSVNRCLFVTRIPICQNIRRRTIQRDSVTSTCKSKINTELKCPEQCNNDDFNDDTPARLDEEDEKLDDTCSCSRLDRSAKDTEMEVSRDETGSGNEERITCAITECVPKYHQDLTSSCCNESCENITEEICDVTSHIDNSKERGKEYLEISDSIEMNRFRGNDAEKIEDVSCELRLSSDEKNNENTFSDQDGSSQCDCRRSPKKKKSEESNLGEEICNANARSIASFAQNSERDKQLVELNCNRFSDVGAIDERSEDDGSLNSARAEIGGDSSRCDDFIDITIINNISGVACFDASRNNLATKTSRNANHRESSSENDDSLVIAVQTPRSQVSSKSINVNLNYPRTVVWLTSGDDEATSTVMRTRNIRCFEAADPSTLIIPRKRHEIFNNKKKVFDGTPSFIKPPGRFSRSRSGLESNGDSKDSNISTEEYFRATCATSNVSSRCCRSFATTNKFIASDRRNKFEKSHGSRRLPKLRVSSSDGIRSVTSFAAIKYRTASRNKDDSSVKAQPQAVLVMAKFRDSVDRSLSRIKRLIHSKLGKILINDGAKTTNASTTFSKNEEISEDTTRGRTSRRCVRQGYSITSCSTSNCYRRGCTLSSRKSSKVILSIRRNRCEEGGSKDGMKFRSHRRLIGGSETLSTFRSIETSYDLSTPTRVEDLEERKSSDRMRCNRREGIERDTVRNVDSCNFKNSPRSTKVPITWDDLRYLERYTWKRREETRDDKRVYERSRHRDRWKEARRGRREETYREVPINSSNEFLRASSSYIRRETRVIRDARKQSRSDGPRGKKARGSVPSKSRHQMYEKDRFDDDRKGRAFAIPIGDDYDDLDLDFKLHLLRYVKLCRSVKRALMRMLRPDDDFYEVSATSSATRRRSSTEEFDST